LVVLGFYVLNQCKKHSVFYTILAILLWLIAICGYAPVLNLMLVLTVSLFIRDYLICDFTSDLLKQINLDDKYRLYVVGELLGRQKFTNIKNYKNLVNQPSSEYYSFAYYLGPFIESSLFFSEKYNPIYGNLFILNGNTIPVLNNEFLSDAERKKYKSFSKTVSINRNKVRKRLINPDKRKVLVDDENIFIYLSNNHEHYKIIMNYFGL
jgi:hypothetical protein